MTKIFLQNILFWGILCGIVEIVWEWEKLPFHIPAIFYILFILAQIVTVVYIKIFLEKEWRNKPL